MSSATVPRSPYPLTRLRVGGPRSDLTVAVYNTSSPGGSTPASATVGSGAATAG